MKITEEELVEKIRTGKSSEIEKHIGYLYEYLRKDAFRSISNYICNHGGKKTDSEDIFQEAICELVLIIQQGKYREEARLGTLLYSIARNMWVDEIDKKHSKGGVRKIQIDEVNQFVQELGINVTDPKVRKVLQEAIDQMGHDCRKLLTLFYFNKLPLVQIMRYREFSHFTTEKGIRDKKYYCWKAFKIKIKEKLEHFLKNNPSDGYIVSND